ncbi:hypothetical protein NUV25_18805 [Burkholderia pseudomultivorans]|uniref:hypothetical protein n=1 Tax=Burkholderia pseudomultivorans TaxID=1207504 RepID=UPI002875B605|nr:hypothetical protein [Burkholderia pseudomultivorans]MDS0859761.1 hypothetical protein [Burkholderia pseudomultivorans]
MPTPIVRRAPGARRSLVACRRRAHRRGWIADRAAARRALFEAAPAHRSHAVRPFASGRTVPARPDRRPDADAFLYIAHNACRATAHGSGSDAIADFTVHAGATAVTPARTPTRRSTRITSLPMPIPRDAATPLSRPAGRRRAWRTAPHVA